MWCVLRERTDLINFFFSIRTTGWGDLGCNHHLRDLELVVYPRRELAP